MKTKNKRAKNGFKNNISFNFQNTILLSIMFVILIIVFIVLLITYAYTQNNNKQTVREITGNIFSNLATFNNDINSQNFSAIQDNLNNTLINKNTINYILILDKNNNEVYSTNKNVKYIFKQPNNFNSLKLENLPNGNKNNIILTYIPKYPYHIYIGINKSAIIKSLTFDENTIKLFIGMVLLIVLIVSYMLARSIAKPLSDMGRSISKISEGDLSGRLSFTNYREINDLVLSYNMMANTLQRMYSTLDKQVQDRTRELKNAYTELQNTQAMMVHSEKMKSLGELVAGIMHEINNPINFIYGNLVHLDNYSKDLVEIIETYTKHNEDLKEESLKEVNDLKETIDYEFLKSDLPDLIRSCREGADRAKNIIQDLKSFSRMEEIAITNVDVEHEIDTVLNILHNKIKNKATVHKEYAENIPKIEAYGGQLNQVFMNILDNATGAIENTGDIWIRIKKEADKNLIIEIEDNGIGMDEETKFKVFNPFFTTKPVGQGTGLGMSISYKIIKNHQGDIKIESEKGKGSKFIITLPLKIDIEKMNSAMVNNEGT